VIPLKGVKLSASELALDVMGLARRREALLDVIYARHPEVRQDEALQQVLTGEAGYILVAVPERLADVVDHIERVLALASRECVLRAEGSPSRLME
jgi:hypothetical protein